MIYTIFLLIMLKNNNPLLFDEEKYLVDYENFQLYLRVGLKLQKIYRVLEFNQSQWLKPYIEFNTKKRIEAEQGNGKDGKALNN